MDNRRVRKILVVDDEPDLLCILQKILSFVGFTVVTCESGLEALAILDQEAAFDIMLTDVVMPGMDGLELSRRVRERYPSGPAVVLITGDMRHLDHSDAPVQSLPVLKKPFDVGELIGVLEALVPREGASVGSSIRTLG